MSKLAWGASGLLLVLFLLIFVVAKLSVTRLVDFSAMGFEVENTSDARVHAGTMKLRSRDWPDLGIFDLTWSWCPRLSPLTWCTQLKNDSINLNGKIGYRLSNEVNISDMQIDISSLSSFGMASMLFDAGLSGAVSSLRIRDFNCPLRNAADLSAQFKLVNILMLGQSLELIDLKASQDENNYLISLTGAQLQGELIVDSGMNYSAEGEMEPPSALAGMMAGLARPIGEGKYAWEIQGQVPC